MPIPAGERSGPGPWPPVLCAGLAVLSRNTALALVAAAGLFAVVMHGRREARPALALGCHRGRHLRPLGVGDFAQSMERRFIRIQAILNTTSPGRSTITRKGTRFLLSSTRWKTCPEIVRVKIKSLILIVVYSTMIVGLPIVVGFCRRLGWGNRAGTRDRPAGRDDLRGVRAGDAQEHRRRDAGCPARALLFAGLRAHVARGHRGTDRAGWMRRASGRKIVPWAAATYCALVWADPTWAYDASWLTKRYQLHWPALVRGRRVDRRSSRPSVPRRPGS